MEIRLPLSRFDVGGDVVQNGLKGFIYGERGVWRPGDSLFLSFILEDKLKKLPGGYPVTFELYNPQGQLVKRFINGKSLNGFYAFRTATESTAPTGNWMAKVKQVGQHFQKPLKLRPLCQTGLKSILILAGILIWRWWRFCRYPICQLVIWCSGQKPQGQG